MLTAKRMPSRHTGNYRSRIHLGVNRSEAGNIRDQTDVAKTGRHQVMLPLFRGKEAVRLAMD